MTTEELILGHFDGALTPEQEKLLQSQLNASPEKRAMYDQHKTLNQMLATDAGMLGPSSRVDEAALAAALGTVPEVVGGSALGWLSGKMVATISAVIIGGASLAVIVNSGSDPVPAQNAPVRNAPAAQSQTAPAAPAPAPQVEDPKSDAATTEVPNAEKPAVNSRTSDRVAKSRSAGTASTVSKEKEKPRLKLPSSSTRVDHGTKTQDQSGK